MVKPSYDKDCVCKYCGVCYSYSSGLYRHMKECKSRVTVENINITDMNSVINKLFEENADFKKMMIESLKSNQDTTNKVLELCKSNSAASVTNNIYNHPSYNNHFSISIFLNETCKHAMNMNNFIKSIKISVEDMVNIVKRGYVKGISSIFINALKKIDIHKRPIHCGDFKRKIFYVKDSNKWERADINSQIMKNAIRTLHDNNIVKINEWFVEHPGCENKSNPANDTYLKLSKYACDWNDYCIFKVIKLIAKETVIDKSNDDVNT